MGAFVGLVALLWLTAAVACGQVGGEEGQGGRPVQEKPIEKVLEEHTDALMAIPGVVGTAQGQCAGQPCIKVFVAKKTPDLLKQIPPELDGYPVAVEETGEIRALDSG